jgi:fumarate hydratase, class II
MQDENDKAMNQEFRSETDSMGEMRVPASAYYGAQTARAVENFPISDLRFSRKFIKALGLVKNHAARANESLGLLPQRISSAIQEAAEEVVAGHLDRHFVVDVFQTGSGTSTNMNANEVIANRASELLGGKRGDKSVHPNDHVNLGQSSNDVIPTVIHLAALDGIVHGLTPAVSTLHSALQAKAAEFASVLKIGRTHLQDATPMRLGQEFSGYASQLEHALARIRAAQTSLSELALGGTAVGTGLNTHGEFASRTIAGISDETGLSLVEAPNHFAAQGAIDACVELSGTLKGLAISLSKIANDIRWLGSGPRCGLGELRLPATQPGSSIMPGKVNPVMCEMVIQVAAQIIGNDATISFGATSGFFELNTMLPVTGYNLLQSIELLSSACRTFAERCIQGLEADQAICEGNIEKSLAMCTALAPVLGYDKAAQIAKRAFESGRTVREVAREMSGLDESTLQRLLDPATQTEPTRGRQ